jgi:uncharacterized protein
MTTLVPPELLGSVVAYFRPQRIILFGSAARGEAGPESDLDLVVVLDDDVPSEKLTARAVAEARAGYHAPVDIIPCRGSRSDNGGLRFAHPPYNHTDGTAINGR